MLFRSWVNYHFGKPAACIELVIVYLSPVYCERKVKIDDERISDFAGTVESETKEMYEYLSDIERNIPKDKKKFHLTEKTFFCKYCSYREICKGC